MTTPFPVGGRAIVDQLVAKFPALAVNDDDLQRQLTIKIGEQFAHSYGPRWGNKKRAGLSDDFRSKDSLAVQEFDGTTSVWDLFSSSVAILVNDGDLPAPGTHANLSPGEATFMPCEAVNHLGLNEPAPDPEPEPDPEIDPREIRMLLTTAIVSLEEVKATVRMLTDVITGLAAVISESGKRPPPPVVFPEYTGKLLGYSITLRPKV